jgi:hypothetical protein
MGIDDLGFGFLLDLFALFVLGDEEDAHAQDDTFTSAPIGRRGGGMEIRGHGSILLPSGAGKTGRKGRFEGFCRGGQLGGVRLRYTLRF